MQGYGPIIAANDVSRLVTTRAQRRAEFAEEKDLEGKFVPKFSPKCKQALKRNIENDIDDGSLSLTLTKWYLIFRAPPITLYLLILPFLPRSKTEKLLFLSFL